MARLKLAFLCGIPYRQLNMQALAEKKTARRVLSLGKHIVRDSGICHGKPTFRGTRVLVADALEMLADEMTPEQVCTAYNGEFTADAIREAMLLARDLFNGTRWACHARRLAVAA